MFERVRFERLAFVAKRFVVVAFVEVTETISRPEKRRADDPRDQALSLAGTSEELSRAVRVRRSEVLFPSTVFPRMERSPLEVTLPRREMVKTSDVVFDPRRR